MIVNLTRWKLIRGILLANSYPWDSIYHRNLLPDHSSNASTGSVGYLSKIRSWMETCDKNHQGCIYPGSRTNTNLPTRVLDIRPTLKGKDPLLHISNGEKAPFMCLSYCWGGSLPIRTTQETIARFREGIPWNSLPRTFQDAVSVARFLGISFLWIDSLCIIQDDEQDWESEAAQMANIYGRSTLIVAATQSSSPSAGLFHTLAPDCIDRPVSHNVLPPKTPPLYYSSTISHEELQNCMDNHPTTEQDGVFPLLRRAWAFQEHLLSPRIVHFTTRELVWECSQTISCCCTPANTIGPGLQKQVSSLLGKAMCKLPTTSEHEWFTLWYRIVSCYTTKCLTRESDRLTALSGIAKMAQARLSSQYLAGLWENDLARGLEWTVCTTTHCPRVPISRRLSKYRAPTWSWASVEGQVEWKSIPRPNGVNILRSHCEISNLDTTGAVHGGYLHLSGLVISAYYHYGYPWLYDSPYALSSANHPYGEKAVSFIPDICIELPGEEKIDPGASLYCLALHGKPTQESYSSSSYFMILRIIHSRWSNEFGYLPTYSRVGIGWSRMSDHSRWVNFFESAIEKEIIVI
jgi:Heterokaryon incompatibility protein (HET)